MDNSNPHPLSRRSMPSSPPPRDHARRPDRRPAWARRTDRLLLWGLPLSRWLRITRPSEALLARLARRDRPAPTRPRLGLDAALNAGREAFQAGQYGEALHHFDQVLLGDPDAPWAWHGRGDALQLLGDPAGALDAYDHALASHPDRPHTELALHQAGRSNALRALGHEPEAQLAWEQALSLDPSVRWMREHAG